MTISELIERLEALKAEHGDLRVRVYEPSEPDPHYAPEIHVDDDGLVIW